MALDVAQPLPVGDADFDGVYARLSLHYFSDEATKAVFREIARVLTKGGLLAFMCKSVDDPLYGKGRRIAEHIFESHHIRHFFSAAYARECMAPYFEVIKLENVRGELYGEDSAYVKAIALRR
jgi:ubiquinone/menaquinone biosynthesis C-methylase UbiE